MRTFENILYRKLLGMYYIEDLQRTRIWICQFAQWV